CQHGYGVPYSF
nr:immunoglobulin light chain junction region [Macaca mulatta]MOX97351.1 immunoglobulin light chain junction region [Macaca mulatta]MOX97490.1 immunoglobulin light chain junction region [Macaca mulatta]MOX97493.1 immunoglobulin light chain junction region [Macaca mulatta]MOX97587.1 immunoglobulin light chain junction region [Macaca mulatta]